MSAVRDGLKYGPARAILPERMTPLPVSWWAEGELFEGCNCNLLCPCHITFRQPPTNGFCEAIWGAAFEQGRFGDTNLAGLGAVIFVHSPGPTMADGNWTSVLYVDEAATGRQAEALRAIFSGEAGGPWEILGQFYRDGKLTAVRKAPLDIEIDASSRTLRASDKVLLEVQAIRGSDRDGPATIANLRNVIHGSIHTLARSNQSIRDETLSWEEQGKHGLFSRFRWEGTPPP